ncbi:MAG: ATP-grasp domain-containing protein [Alphaproteobacteria bacterium]|nr:ATP-grasp domain-containing protein [Alphaproteobacteria bacterium]
MADHGFLIAALSGRSLAAAAARAGHGVFVLDLFNDSDLATLARKSAPVEADAGGGFDGESLLGAAGELKCGEAPLVFGAGFEDRPELLGRLAEDRTLCGNSPQTLTRIKDPGDFFVTLDGLGIRHPQTSLTLPENSPAGWLVKPVGGSGGRHIREIWENNPSAPVYYPPFYYQRELAGRAVSLLFLGDGKRICALGLSEQFPTPFPPDHPFRFGFAVTLPDGDATLMTGLTRTAMALTKVYGLVGLNSLDALMDEAGELSVLEVNPRPGATLDLFDPLAGTPLFDLHVEAVAGNLPHDSEIPRGQADVFRACGILYADTSFHMGEDMDWPVWGADRPRTGTAFAIGDPICTIFAEGGTPAQAMEFIAERAGALRNDLARCKGADH